MRAQFGLPPHADPPRRPAVWDVLTGLVPVALAIVALFQGEDERFWGLLALAALGISISLYRPALEATKRWLANRHDERLARRALQGLEDFVARFGELVGPDRNDTLQATLQSAFQSVALPQQLRIPSVHWFNTLVGELRERLRNDPSDLAHFVRAHGEFYTIVSAYSNQCIEPIYQSMPQDVRQILTPASRSALEAFRERYVGFRDGFVKYSNDTAGAMRAPRFHPAFVYRPQPVTA